MKESNTLTAQYLRGDKVIVQPESRRPTGDRWVQICNARQNNLQGISPKIPVGTLCCVTGVSGSGKSSLIHDILYSALARDLMKAKTVPGDYDDIRGIIEGKAFESPMSLTKLSTSTWHLSGEHHAPTPRPIQKFLMLFAHSMRVCLMRNCEAINPGTVQLQRQRRQM